MTKDKLNNLKVKKKQIEKSDNTDKGKNDKER